ncbi:MAG: fibronectin type III domain-containing protein [Melioribacteraceae bacterium]|nr:fibronectin type III domain-containing protein [Melioribacteraceae bacterium]
MAKKYVKILFLIIFLSFFISCVDSITDSPQATAPTIKLIFPDNGDTVQVGENEIQYEASAGRNSSGLSKYEVWLNDEFQKQYNQNSDGTNPKLFLIIDSSLINTKISYYVNVYSQENVITTSEVKENIHVSESKEPPKAPANLVLTKINDRTINLFWDDSSSNESSFEVWRKVGADANYSLYKTLPENSISTNDENLSPVLDYYYKVRAINQYGASPFSNEVSTISGPVLSGEILGSSTIRLTWEVNDQSTNVLGFKIQRTNPTTGDFSQIAITGPLEREYTDGNLLQGTTYSYRIASFTESSQSVWSNIVTLTTSYVDVPAPSNLVASFRVNKKNVLVRWQDKTALENGTLVERSVNSLNNFEPIGSTATDIDSLIDVNVTAGNIYYYRARHSSTEGFFTQYSNIDSARVVEVAPIAPSNLTILPVSGSTNEYSIFWNDNSDDEEGFQLWAKETNLGTYQLFKTYGVNVSADRITLPNPNSQYFFKVRAFRGSFFSSYSNEVNTQGSFISDITLTVTNLTATQVSLQFNDPYDNEIVYELERRRSFDASFSVYQIIGAQSGQGGSISFNDNNVARTLTYIYRVRARFSNGYSDYSNEVQVTIPNL